MNPLWAGCWLGAGPNPRGPKVDLHLPQGSSHTSSEGAWTLLAPTPVPPAQKVRLEP